MVTESGVFVQTLYHCATLLLSLPRKSRFRFNWNVWYILVWKTVPCFHVINHGLRPKVMTARHDCQHLCVIVMQMICNAFVVKPTFKDGGYCMGEVALAPCSANTFSKFCEKGILHTNYMSIRMKQLSSFTILI